jgi:hypothetical protein
MIVGTLDAEAREAVLLEWAREHSRRLGKPVVLRPRGPEAGPVPSGPAENAREAGESAGGPQRQPEVV